MLGLSDPEDFNGEGSSSSSGGSGHRLPAEQIWKSSTTCWGTREPANDEDCVIDDLESNVKTAVSRGRIVVLEPGPHSDEWLSKSLQAEEDGRMPGDEENPRITKQNRARELMSIMHSQAMDMIALDGSKDIDMKEFDQSWADSMEQSLILESGGRPNPNEAANADADDTEEDMPFLKLASDSEAEDEMEREKKYDNDDTDVPFGCQMYRWIAPRWTRKMTIAVILMIMVTLVVMRIEAPWSWWEKDFLKQLGAIVAVALFCFWFCMTS
mmetsp:Transcript_145322/g.253618  ORF Transcript_145322/g.253618 Transcript_145322/m.253618 type:complete len:269 (+) Transcript_145322:39-845(+)